MRATVLGLAVLAACAGGSPGVDAGPLDAGAHDAGPVDAGPGICGPTPWGGPGNALGGTLGFNSASAGAKVTSPGDAVDISLYQGRAACGIDAGPCEGSTITLHLFSPVGNPGLRAGEVFNFGTPQDQYSHFDADLYFPSDHQSESVCCAASGLTGTATLTALGPTWAGTFSLSLPDMSGTAQTLTGSFSAPQCP